MGLDMYLSKKVNIRNWDHMPDEERYHISVTRGGKELTTTTLNPERVEAVVEEVGCWRKANAIHGWFVTQCAEGVDDCRPVFVSRDKLEALLERVNRVLAASELVEGQVEAGQTLKDGQWVPHYRPGKVIQDPTVARELLPTQAGFFFGGTAYDEWYYRDLVETRRIVTEALADEAAEDFEYQASW